MERIKHPWRTATIVLSGVVVILALILGYTRVTSAPTIAVTGQASLPATFDIFTFTPFLQGADTGRLAASGQAIVGQLKQLGVKAEDIKTSVIPGAGQQPSKFNLVVTVHGQSTADSVAAYLPTTGAISGLAPQKSVSAKLHERLDTEARRLAVRDARTKALTLARGLHAKVGKVVKVTETGAHQFNVVFQLN